MDNIIIDIGANTKEFLTGLSDIGDKTNDLGDQLKGVGALAATAFAGYTAAIMGSVYAYREQEQVGQEINAVIQSTGGIAGVTAQAVDDLADSLSKTTTFSKLQVEQGEKTLLTFDQIGKDTFPAATKAALDMAQATGMSASSAAQILGRALQDPMTATTKLTREGITFTAQQKAQIQAMELSGNIAGAQGIILQVLSEKYGGMAAAAAGGTGQIAVLKNSMEDLAEKIGAEFAPYVAAAAAKLNQLVQYASEHEGILEFTAAVLAGGAAVTGAVTALVAGAFAVKQITSVIEVATAATKAFGLSAEVAMGATGVGLLVVVAAEVYAHWNTLWPAMQEVFHTFVTTVTNASQGLGKVIQGAFSLNLDQIKEGLAQAAQAFSDGAKQTGHTVAHLFAATPEARQVASDAGKELAMAQARANIEATRAAKREADQELADSQRDALQAQLLELQGFTKQVVDLKKQQAATEKQLSTSTNAEETALLKKHLTELQAEYDKAVLNEANKRTTADKLKITQDKKLSDQEKTQLISSINTEQDAQHAFYMQQLQEQITSNNQFLADQAQFGTAYASIDQAMRSTMLTQASSSFSQLTQLTQSKNSELKGIGQAASVADIEIKSAQGAMAAYAGFASIPIIGIPLGIAAAAAIELYGQERVAQVLGANAGGVYSGGIAGVDSIPALYTPGELVVPTQNFNEVVNSVAARRSGQTDTQNGSAQPMQVQLVVSFKGNAGRMLQVQAVQDKALGVYRGT